MASHCHLSHPKYRADIDGLRAVAVSAVVLFHAFPHRLPGGFIGVDVFFVISGFLISTILFQNLKEDTFTFAEFYSRRVRRIFPALLLILALSFALGWLTLLPHELKQLGKHMAGGAGFVSNLVLKGEAGYFDNSAESKPLLHLWSLGIEEQFYFFYPLLLWITWKLRGNLLAVTVVVAVLSFALNLRVVASNAVTAFYSPQTRFWELMCGGILAWLHLYAERPQPKSKLLSNLCSSFGIILLVYGLIYFRKGIAFPGYWALVPVVSAILILSARGAWFNQRVLSNRAAVGLGLISFPLYLWHWMLLSFARILGNGKLLPLNLRLAIVLFSVPLAWLTYRSVEKPLRFGGRDGLKVSLLTAAMLLVGLTGFITYRQDGLTARNGRFVKISEAIQGPTFPAGLPALEFNGRLVHIQKSGRDDTTLVVGDSNAEQYYTRIDEKIRVSPADTNSVIFVTGGGCLPIPGSPYDFTHRHCDGLMETAYRLATENPNVKNIVISALWTQYLLEAAALQGEFGLGTFAYQAALERLSTYLSQLKDADRRVFLISSIPRGEALHPAFTAQRSFGFSKIFSVREGGIHRKSLERKYGSLHRDLQKVARATGTEFIDPYNFLCDRSTCPSLDKNGEPIYRDSDHLNPAYVRKNANFIDSTVF